MNVEDDSLDRDHSPERRVERGGHTLSFVWKLALLSFQTVNSRTLLCWTVQRRARGQRRSCCSGSRGDRGAGATATVVGSVQRGCRRTLEQGFVLSCPSAPLQPETPSRVSIFKCGQFYDEGASLRGSDKQG